MLVQERLEVVELALIHRALGQEHDVDGSGLPPRGAQHAVQQLEVEALVRRELEEAEWLLPRPVHRLIDRPEVGRVHPQRPRQQQQRGVFGLQVRPPMPRRQLVPARRDARSDGAGITRERRAPGGRGLHLGEYPQQAWVDAGDRPGPAQQLAAPGAIERSDCVGGVERDTQAGARFVGHRMQRQQ
jgi:hypothetical protein